MQNLIKAKYFFISKTIEDTLESKKHTSKYSSSDNLRKSGSNISLNKGTAGPTRLTTSRLSRFASRVSLTLFENN